jgi:hypothetical protein
LFWAFIGGLPAKASLMLYYYFDKRSFYVEEEKIGLVPLGGCGSFIGCI